MIAPAPAKINLALVVGPRRDDGKHEVLTVLQRIDLGDRISVEPAAETRISGFPGDTLVRAALDALAAPHGWDVHITKNVPVAAGLGGGSSDAATALHLANGQLAQPRTPAELHAIAGALGSDVPFFLRDGPQLATGDGSELEPLELPQDFVVVVVVPHGVTKSSTAEVYERFDARAGEQGWQERFAALHASLGSIRHPRDLAVLPPNDLVRSPLVADLMAHDAFRADVSGAGPAVYGLFHRRADAARAARALNPIAQTWVTLPVWHR